MSRWIAACAVLSACATPDGEVTGPYTGPVERFVIDAITIPSAKESIARYAGDLDGDDLVDNRFGGVTRDLRTVGDLTSAGPDMIASGVLRSFVELQADDLDNDESVEVRYLGRDGDGDTAIGVGARLRDGTLLSNRTRSSEHLGSARVQLPVFVESDPSEVTLAGLEVDLQPDGVGGFTGIVRGGLVRAEIDDGMYVGMVSMLAANPGAHKSLRQLLEGSGNAVADGVLTRAEVVESSFLISVLAPDLDLDGVGPAVSFGFGIHLSRCTDGMCPARPPVGNHCQDRVRDGDETDVDCGGSCLACAASRACAASDDCQSGTCSAGACTAPTCTDGIENGFEGDIDCGGVCSTKCVRGQRCDDGYDCASGMCASGVCQ